jgi:hypothetical protein
MTFKRDGQFVAGNAASVVRNINAINPARRQANGDTPRACVDGVFDKLLKRAGGAFDNLSGGNAIHQIFGQAAY